MQNEQRPARSDFLVMHIEITHLTFHQNSL
jgi:hypothetical protein